MNEPAKKTPAEIAARTPGVKLGSELGKKRCAGCGNAIAHDEASPFCRSDCAENARRARSKKDLREAVFARDRGVCAKCLVDCIARRELVTAEFEASKRSPRAAQVWRTARLRALAKEGIDQDAAESGDDLWECDHIDPQVFDGPSTLENAQTLCLGCHKAKSAAEKAERARARRSFR